MAIGGIVNLLAVMNGKHGKNDYICRLNSQISSTNRQTHGAQIRLNTTWFWSSGLIITRVWYNSLIAKERSGITNVTSRFLPDL